jgi:deazaflavin-dependent oxidoreductase (nitroreductase family)
MNFKDGANIVAHLTTIGRKSGRPRSVELRFLHFKGNFYATSSRVEGKHWCQNLIQNPAVQISVQGEILSCTAKQVTDDDSRKRILILRDSPPQLNRVVFEITPQKQPLAAAKHKYAGNDQGCR